MINCLTLCVALSMVVGCTWAAATVNELADQNRGGPMLGCHKRVFTYRVSQTDSKGRECWDHVSVWSCHGRCDSNEISDWRFPYKRSHHPVCMHAGRTRSVAVLRHCHPDADPEAKLYEYMEPKSCSCQTCTSMDTSCEGPKQLNTDAVTKIFQIEEEEIESEYA
ncbi:glycoprotein hormone beta subunit [Culex quinquefasciatus]|uniref:Glycoprotein hormone beta subunit n=1 Tax=Culex quinquefasciatus TaxID=7176 RepID=B0X0Y2_CULQU|nr:thyrostimulin beta-5 subunit [Culex pipiens pallens]EDS38374.1 glycoprotein hormone beta subunit [Culex quinquefasciatus]CAR95347.1 TPA: putative glycoprotein hormone-beta5 [Culex quinquefasciatus]|eukprot:XP_001863304.1 glycoprotein hormone beta subunit [Culex quinquefasciatus]